MKRSMRIEGMGRGLVLSALAFATGLALCVGSWGSDAQSLELLKNGGFELLDAEGGPEAWRIYNWSDSRLVAARMAPGGRFGHRCLQLSATAGPVLYGCFSQPVTFADPPPGQLILTIWHRGDPATRPEIGIVTFSEDFQQQEWKTPILTAESFALQPQPKQWQRDTFHFRLLPSVRQAIVVARIHGGGSLFLDGVSLKAYPAELESTLIAPGLVLNTKGEREARLRLINRTDAPLALRLSGQVIGAGAKPPRAELKASVRLAAGQTYEVALRYRWPLDQEGRLILTVVNEAGDAIYDTLMAEVPGLLKGRIVTPSFRATILPGRPASEIVAEGVIHAAPALRREIKLTGRLAGVGLELGEIAVDEAGRWRVQAKPGSLLAGNYAVQLRAQQAGRTLAEYNLPFLKPPPAAGQAYYDERLRFFLNGQPRFPIGAFMALDEADLSAVAEAGFNTVVLPSRLASTAMMEKAQQLGLAVLLSSANVDLEFWQNQIRRHDAQPCLAGYYILQRPETESPPVLPAAVEFLYQQLARLDPQRPVCLAVGSLTRMAEYAPACDILMPWTEPEPVGDLRAVDSLLREAAALVAGRKPFWAIVPITGAAYATDSRLDPAGNGRPPTPEEYRCLVYLSLARGAQGLFCRAYRVAASTYQRDYLISRDAPALWESVKRVNQELRALMPILLEGEPIRVETSNGAVAMRAYAYEQAAYILVANPLGQPVALTFKIAGMPSRVLEGVFSNQRLEGAAEGEFTDLLEPHGVRVYKGPWKG